MKTYLVGGAVRDRLLGLTVKDRDWVVVGATPDKLRVAGYKAVGKDFPVFLHPDTHEEYALARTERKSGPGYHGFVFNTDSAVTLEDDLHRRDLTINAIACDNNGNLIDPHNGQRDIEQRLLRHVSAAFVEDPVRVLRIARFMARLAPFGFSVAPETLALMKSMVETGEVDNLVAERVWQELAGALAANSPRAFVETLRSCGALAVVLPEVDRLFGVPQKPEWHPEIDTGLHTLLVLDQAAASGDAPEMRFAALCHDLGKGTTPVALLPSHTGHEARGAELCNSLCERLRTPRRFRDLAVLTARYHLHCHRAKLLRPGKLLNLLQALDVARKPQRFEYFLSACEADARGRTGFENRAYPEADYLREAADLLGSVDAGRIARSLGADSSSNIPDAIHRAQLRAMTDHVHRHRAD